MPDAPRTSATGLIHIEPAHDRVWIAGQPALLVDSVAFGNLRASLLENLGPVVTRATLTRFGFEQGWQVATRLQERCAPHEMTAWLAQNRDLAHLSGLHRFADNRSQLFASAGWSLIESVESRMQLETAGPCAIPVCWLICGLVSGYLSAALQRQIYVIEQTCAGQGDAACCLRAGDAEGWSAELVAELQPFFPPTLPTNSIVIPAGANPSGATSALKLNLPTAPEITTHFIARSAAMRRVMELALQVAAVESSVIITGESGTGKERLARFIHDQSSRRKGPFIAVNCGAVAETLLASELFGHVRGAYTGAVQDRQGLFEAATGGTLLLDEIGEIPPPMQIQLLRVLQNQEIRRVGESVSRPIDVRVIAATNRDLTADITTGRFRKDLYFRLNVLTLNLPRLRERAEDLIPLANLALADIAAKLNRTPLRLAPTASRQLAEYSWPGNVRELENLIERAVTFAPDGATELIELPIDLHPTRLNTIDSTSVRPLRQVEQDYILSVLHLNGGNQTRTAAQLKIGATTLYRKLKSYGLVQPRRSVSQPTAEGEARLHQLDRRKIPGRRKKEGVDR